MTVRRLVLLLFCLGAAACEMPQKSADVSTARLREAQDTLTSAKTARAVVPVGSVVVHEGAWIGGHSVSHLNGEPLPGRVEAGDAVVLNSMGVALDLREIAAEVTAQTGLHVVLDDQVDVPAAAPANVAPVRPRAGMALSWSGSLSGLLDSVATFFGLQWEYRDNQIRMFRFEVRTFSIAALPSSSTVRAAVNTTGGGTGTGATQGTTAPAAANMGGAPASVSGSMMQDTANETTVKLWDDLKETIQAILPAGGKVAMSPATGTFTVIAPPSTIRRVAAFVDQQNARITRQVNIAVKVLRVDLTDTYDLGLDLGVVFQQMAGRYGLNFSGPAPLSVSAGTPASFLVQATQGQWAGGANAANPTRAVVDALQTMGKVTLVTETSVTTLNGQAAPVSVAEQRSYVASTATTLAGGAAGTVQTQITPASLITGFNMQVFPRILDDGEILLQYGLSLSDLKGLTVFGQAGNQIQLPDINLRSFLQQALMRSGDLLVLAGYQSASDTQGNTGLPGIGPSLFGGSVQDQASKSIIVILMAPEVLVRGAAARAAS